LDVSGSGGSVAIYYNVRGSAFGPGISWLAKSLSGSEVLNDLGRIASSEMLRRVALVRTDVSEELIASIITVKILCISSQRASVASYG
jgi:hypothetical protein